MMMDWVEIRDKAVEYVVWARDTLPIEDVYDLVESAQVIADFIGSGRTGVSGYADEQAIQAARAASSAVFTDDDGEPD